MSGELAVKVMGRIVRLELARFDFFSKSPMLQRTSRDDCCVVFVKMHAHAHA